MSIFILGRNGYIANRLINKIPLDENIIQTSSTDHLDSRKLDLLDPSSFDYSLIKENDLVLFLAAVSSPDMCTTDFERSYKINVLGTKYVIDKCLEKKAKVLFFSSDIVYGQTHEAVDEKSSCNPVGKYAEMKYEIEQSYLNNNHFKIFRLSFVLSIEDKFSKYLRSYKGVKLEVFHPILRSVVYVEDLIDAILSIKEKWELFEHSIINICGPEVLSRVDLVEIFNNSVNNKVQYKINQPGEEFYISRPKTIEMKSLYLEKLLNRKTTSIRDAYKLELTKGD